MKNEEFKKRYLAARRGIIARDFSALNDMQRQAVMATEGPVLLLAGAGSGKTTVLINRVANLLRYGRASDSDELPAGATEDDLSFLEGYLAAPSDAGRARAVGLCALEPVDPWRVIAITFTNKAADELRARLEKMLGAAAGDVWAMTFHSACARILRRSGDAIGIPRSFTIYDTSDSAAVMKRVLKELELDEKMFPPKAILAEISRAKDAVISPDAFMEAAEKGYDPRKKYIGRAYQEYARRLRAAGALDFDDLILFTVKLLAESKETREYYQRLFRYVLVDEYQDTNHLQYLLAGLLAGGNDNICVVGDDDQSIYKFRGATIENILSFEKRYANARTIKLEQNYRSTSHILSAANAVIKHNRERKGKELWTALGEGEKLRLCVAENDDEEAAFVAARILGGMADGMKWSDFAVLYRMNAQSNRLEYAFKRNGIPYRVIGGTRFFDRAEIKDVMSYLCVVQNPEDDLRLIRIVNNPPRGIGAATLERVRAAASAAKRPIIEAMRSPESFGLGSAPRLAAFAALIGDLRTAAASMPLDEFYDVLLEKSGYLASLGDSDEALGRGENIRELRSNIVSFLGRAPEPTLAAFLDETALYTDIDGLDPGADSAVMMTMHSAKGLEFPWVFIVGMEDGIFPSLRSIGEAEEMEEERRLCYVALTRAKKRLFLTAARRRMLFGHTSSNALSRFLDEIPPEDIDRPPAQRPAAVSYDFERESREPDPEYMEHRRRETEREQHFADRSRTYAPRESGPVRSAPPRASRPAPAGAPQQAAPLLSLAPGDAVAHTAFGRGVVKSVVPMPGDALLTVTFEKAGEKRLMLRAASAFMKKA